MKGPRKSLDRISTLPQDAIDLILSLMPIQDALRTSVLSRKWRLKKLRLFEVDITNKMLQGFLTNCPLLEEFTWARGYYTNTKLSECEFVELFKCLPSIQVLRISQLYIEHLGAGSNSMPHKLPISLPHLRILILNVCFLDLSTVLCVISSSPNLEKIKVEMCWDHDEHCLQHTFNNLPDIQEDYSGLNLDHLKELEITNFHNHGVEMEFVKLIMGKSPVLKKARIELHYRVSVNEEVKMLRGLVHMPFPRASPTVGFTIKRYNEIDLL
ncbi:F-box/FBD/LRR-repeat protein At1g13570 isoform X2 [Lactuca sativa]|uniref:F-box/FBD/LRR-repeat protein At1g13570 isoform X2 n=1 Tax=Lactuca sativa TaxID=4236 RepID=UPI000CD97E8A|nr:F-box/FBD/LRR-repeat protein At1g13570 isoform X2 [Lactuca sativa]